VGKQAERFYRAPKPVAVLFTAGLAASNGGTSEYKVGVYGSGAVCDSVKRTGLAQYAWLSNSTAWAGRSFAGWNIRQGRPYAIKQVAPGVKEEDAEIVVITVYTFYF